MSIFNLNVEKKKKTGPITPKYEGIYPPAPSCEPPKKELPDPPFNATAARSYAHWKEEKAINVIKNNVWEDIKKEVKKGGVILHTSFYPYPRFSPRVEITDIERACALLSSKLYKILVDFGEELVKMGYTITVINDIYPFNEMMGYTPGFYPYNTHSLDKVQMKICWGEPEDTQEPYLKTIDYAGLVRKELDEDKCEHLVRPEKVTIKTKGELENGDKSDE